MQARRSRFRFLMVSLGIFFDVKSIRLHNGTVFDPASNKNEYQEYFLAGKGGRCVGLTNLTTFM